MVIPIFKKGSHTDPGNYRPIALLPIISKVLERIVHDKLSSFLQTWLHDCQSGFKKGDGTIPQLLRLCQEWSRHVDNSAYVGILFFDLRKAFNRVWHDGPSPVKTGSSGDTRLSICLDEELHVAKSPPLKVAHPRPRRLKQVYPRVPFLVLYFFQST